jgi:UDP-2,3-diacylglucosamine hydrolase
VSDKKTYFASDQHLGIPDHARSLEREKRFVRWLDEVKHDAGTIYLLGDLFDFWYEYGTAVPKGYVRVLGKLAELTDAGIKIEAFIGNHDMWMFGYFEKELGIPVHRRHIEIELSGKKFYIGHGDGVGPGDHGYKFIKRVFANPVCQWLFKWIHPDIGIGLANFWSRRSRLANGESEEFLGEEKERQVVHAKRVLSQQHFDYFVFGHRHVPVNIPLGEAQFVNLGDWVSHNTYAVFDGHSLELKKYEDS